MEAIKTFLAYIFAAIGIAFSLAYTVGLFIIQMIIVTAPIWILFVIFGG